MAFPTAYHADSDADDEYERTEMTSPILPTDDDTSPTDSDPPSTEPTPTFGRSDTEKLSPGNVILQWTAEQCVDYVASLGLPQYCDRFLENEIVGEALIALKHDDLKEMGIISMGHRLTILKDVYDVKVKQEIPFDPDHYVPPSAEASTNDRTATQDDISRLIQSMRLRDERLIHTENELRRITEEHRKLRDELLPIFRMAKDRSQPLPFHPPSASPDLPNYDDVMSQAQPEKSGSSLSRKFSTKRLFLGSTPKNNSPTHMPQSIPEGKAMSDNTNLDPSAAVTAAQSHLTASMTGGSQPATSPNQANIPSPTSPNTYANQPTLHSRTFRDVTPNTARYNPHPDDQSQYTTLPNNPDRSNPTPTPGSSSRSTRGFRNDPQDDPPPSGGSSRDREPPSVEIFKSFRVSMEDPCHKVLPAALKKYNINADWRQYALYIVYGDQERCLGLEEKPLILFKQLDREGKKPMFMLRRHAAPIEGHSGPTSGGFEMPVVGGGRAGGSSLQLPGGVL